MNVVLKIVWVETVLISNDLEFDADGGQNFSDVQVYDFF